MDEPSIIANSGIKAGNLIVNYDLSTVLQNIHARLKRTFPDVYSKSRPPKFSSGINCVVEADLAPDLMDDITLPMPAKGHLITISELYINLQAILIFLYGIRRIHCVDRFSYHPRDRGYAPGASDITETVDGYAFLVDNVPSRDSEGISLSSWFNAFVVNSSSVKPTAIGASSSISPGDDIVADTGNRSFTNMFEKLYDAWRSSIERNQVNYTTYRCHSVCYSNCHHRSRR